MSTNYHGLHAFHCCMQPLWDSVSLRPRCLCQNGLYCDNSGPSHVTPAVPSRCWKTEKDEILTAIPPNISGNTSLCQSVEQQRPPVDFGRSEEGTLTCVVTAQTTRQSNSGGRADFGRTQNCKSVAPVSVFPSWLFFPFNLQPIRARKWFAHQKKKQNQKPKTLILATLASLLLALYKPFSFLPGPVGGKQLDRDCLLVD